jgi:hypothetical protein
MCASDTSDFCQTEVVKTTSLYAVSSSAVVKPQQKKKKDQRPGRISCSESAVLISILVRFAKKVRWSGWRFCFLPGAMALRINADEHRQQQKSHISISLRKQHPVSLYSPIV